MLFKGGSGYIIFLQVMMLDFFFSLTDCILWCGAQRIFCFIASFFSVYEFDNAFLYGV